MTDSMNTVLPVVVQTAISVVSKGIGDLVMNARANGVVKRAQFEMLKDQTTKAIALARANNAGDIARSNLEQLMETQRYIDNLEKEGRLHGISLSMAMDQLADLNDTLRKILEDYRNRSVS